MIWKNKYIPFGRFKAMAVWPIIFVRKDKKITEYTLNHERIHFRQQLELLLIGFYIIYFIEYIFKGYRTISFEKEAYRNAKNLNYLKTRKIFGQWRN